jgi:filamentous hemagglutinin family protein
MRIRWAALLPMVGSGLWLTGQPEAIAQTPTPDASLGSSVVPAGLINGQPSDVILNGTLKGQNLFHSFDQFGVAPGRGVYFANPAGVQTILTRVTGSQASQIEGTLGVLGMANLFLLNPNGIQFGPNARLAIGGSFIASTARSVHFNDGTQFDTRASQGPALLSINVPVGLQLGGNPAAIQVNGLGNDGIVPTANLGLTPNAGQTIALVGSDVTLNGGVITALDGRIEVGAVRSGTVALTPTPSGWQLGYGAALDLGDVTLTARSSLWNPHIVGNPWGGIQVVGRDIRLDQSQIVGAAVGSVQNGDVVVRAGRSLWMGGGIQPVLNTPGSWIMNHTVAGATANSGSVQVDAPVIAMQDGATIQTLSLSSGSAGTVQVTADTISLRGGSAPFSTPTGAQVIDTKVASQTRSAGKGGEVQVRARQLVMEDGGRVETTVLPGATGRGGNLTVQVSDLILARGLNPLSSAAAGIQSLVVGAGDGGDVAVSTNQLILQAGGMVNSFVYQVPGSPIISSGKGGNLTVTVQDSIELSTPSFVSSALNSLLGTATTGQGNAGNVTVSTRNLRVQDGASLSSGTAAVFGPFGDPARANQLGNGGNLSLAVSEQLEVSGFNPTSQLGSSIGTYTFGNGNTGDALIRGNRVVIRDGGSVLASTLGSGNAGQLTVQAQDILISGIPEHQTYIAANSPLLPAATRATYGLTDNPTGDLGGLRLQSDRLTVQNGGQVSVRHGGTGDGGRIEIETKTLTLNNGQISASTQSGQGGNLSLQVQDLLLMQRGSEISAESGSIGNGGNIDINATFIVASGNSDIFANAFKGNGGNIQLATQGIFGLKFRPQRTPKNDITASSQFGLSGNVQISTLDIDPDSGLVQLATDLADPSQQIATGCTNNTSSSFIATGRGGIPTNPTQELRSDRPWADTRDLSAFRQSAAIAPPPVETLRRNVSTAEPVIEANAIGRDADGNLELVAIGAGLPVLSQTCAQRSTTGHAN